MSDDKSVSARAVIAAAGRDVSAHMSLCGASLIKNPICPERERDVASLFSRALRLRHFVGASRGMIAAAGANDIPVDDVGIFQSSFDGADGGRRRRQREGRVWMVNLSPMMMILLLLAALSLSTHKGKHGTQEEEEGEPDRIDPTDSLHPKSFYMPVKRSKKLVEIL